jgi:transposase
MAKPGQSAHRTTNRNIDSHKSRGCLIAQDADAGIATRYDKLAANSLAFIKLASIRLWLRAYESTP